MASLSEEHILQGKKKSLEAMERKKGKRRTTAALEVGKLIDEMFDLCEEYDVTRAGNIIRTKERGQIRNWVKECSCENLNPYTILDDVISHWLDMSAQGVKNRFGKEEQVREGFTWQEFYAKRRDIYAWLSIYQPSDHGSRETVTVKLG